MAVILFVRMWVEISSGWRSSASEICHPLREDVSWNNNQSYCVLPYPCHPLREDVSWNMAITTIFSPIVVILFVRMWVEMILGTNAKDIHKVILFVRMWVEISFDIILILLYPVILFVRMWVEISIVQCLGNQQNSSSSSWGCELKCPFGYWTSSL